MYFLKLMKIFRFSVSFDTCLEVSVDLLKAKYINTVEIVTEVDILKSAGARSLIFS